MQAAELVSELLSATPHDLTGRFETTFHTGSPVETGAFAFRDRDHWFVAVDGGPTILSTPRSSTTTVGQSTESGPPMRHLPSRAPWDLIVPSTARIFGRPDDDWMVVGVQPSDHGLIELKLARTDGDERATALVDQRCGVLLAISTPSFHQSAVVDTEPNQDLLGKIA